MMTERLEQNLGSDWGESNNTLLLVDDEENILRSLKRLFRNEGYRLLTAGSGDEARAVMAEQPAAVILSDQRMRGMTGSELFAQLKETHPTTIRIILSGYADLDSITRAINDGAIFKFLLKPWDDDRLKEHIREAFAIHSLQQRNQALTHKLEASNTQLQALLVEKQQALEAHRHALSAFQQLLESVAYPVLGFDPAGQLAFFNRSARETLPTLVLGSNFNDLIRQLDGIADDSFQAWCGDLEGKEAQGWFCRYRVLSDTAGYVLTLTSGGRAVSEE